MEKYSLKNALMRHEGNYGKGVKLYHSDGSYLFCSYGELYRLARKTLGEIRCLGIGPGREMVIIYQEQLRFTIVFWACVLGDIVPVPLMVQPHQWDKLESIVSCCLDPCICCSDKTADELALRFPQQRLVRHSELSGKGPEAEIFPKSTDGPVMILFSSGSTNDPKGVSLSDENVIVNMESLVCACKYTESDIFLNWIPLTHTFGLTYFHIFPLIMGADQIHLTAEAFSRNLLQWLQIVTKERVTVGVMTNYALSAFLQFAGNMDLSEYDLRSMHTIVAGGEMISVELSEQLIEKLACCGFSPNSYSVGYGMSEATVVVTMTGRGERFSYLPLDRNCLAIGERVKLSEGKGVIRIIGVGELLPSLEAKIVDANEKALEDMHVGILKLKGASIMKGYYNNKVMTEDAIDTDGWLDTGDIGFFHEKHLYLTGRYKDLILFNSCNYFSNDIEELLVTRGVCEKNAVAVVGVKQDTSSMNDEIVCFVEAELSRAELVEKLTQIRKLVSEESGILVEALVPVEKISRTSSGKLRRYIMKERYLNHEWDEKKILPKDIIQNDTRDIDAIVLECIAEVKGFVVGRDEYFSVVGISSMEFTRVYERLSSKGFLFPVADLYACRNAEELIEYLAEVQQGFGG